MKSMLIYLFINKIILMIFVYFTLILLQVGQQRPLSNALPDGH